MKEPKNIYELYEIIGKFVEKNKEVPLVFFCTDRKKIVHIITDHKDDIDAMDKIVKSICLKKSLGIN